MKIRAKVLELISSYIKDRIELDDFFEILNEYDEEPVYLQGNTKFSNIYTNLIGLSQSKDEKHHKILYKVIARLAHPLTLHGSRTESQEAIQIFNSWLVYEDLEIIQEGKDLDIISKSEHYWGREELEEFVNREYKNTILHIKKNYTNQLLALKTSYSLMMSIISNFYSNNDLLSEKFNYHYMLMRNIALDTHSSIFQDEIIKNYIGLLPASEFYSPFPNLYSAIQEHESLEFYDRKNIWGKLNNYYGMILEICFDADIKDFNYEGSFTSQFKEVQRYLEENRFQFKIHTNKSNTAAKWLEEFHWDGNEFIFGELGKLKFTSEDRLFIFKQLTLAKGGWVSIKNLRNMKGDNFVRATIKQIEDRMDPKLREYIKITSTQDDDLEPKPQSGAYRIKVI